MKLKMAENSLFAILLRSRWWISLAIACGFVLVSVALLPREYALAGALGGVPFAIIGAIALKRQWGAPSASMVEAQLAQGPYLLGETMSAADVLWGNALAWTTAFGLVQPAPATADYIARMGAMTAFDRSRQIDAELAAA